MLDKSKIYRIYSGVTKPHGNQSPRKKFRRVRILFEDNISFYVESLVDDDRDSRGFHKRYSVKKHCFYGEEIPAPKKVCAVGDLHFGEIHYVPCWGGQNCPICALLGSPIEKKYRAVTGTELFNLIFRANLIIKNGRVWKNQYGPVGREADKGDYERADLVIKNGFIVRDDVRRISK